MTIGKFMLVIQPKRPTPVYQCKDFLSQDFNTEIDMWCTYLNLITLLRGLNEDDNVFFGLIFRAALTFSDKATGIGIQSGLVTNQI